MPYQLLIFIGTLLPIDPLLWYKLTSIAFDYILAGQAYCLTREITGSRNRAALAYGAILFLPPVFLNSAAWAQCDSIYVSFVLASIRKLLAGKQRLAFFLLGIALSFKLQACFAIPFYFYFCVTRKTFNPLDLLLLAGGFYLLSIPGILSGRSIADPINIYLSQTTTYPMMYLNYPSFWVMPNGDYKSLKMIAIGITALILAIEIVLLYQKPIVNCNHLRGQIKIATLLVWTCLEFLPAMHERYGYLVTILMTIVVLVSNRPKIEVFCLSCLLVCDCATYGNYLFGASFDLLPLSLLHFAAWTVYLGSCLATPRPPSHKKTAPQNPEQARLPGAPVRSMA